MTLATHTVRRAPRNRRLDPQDVPLRDLFPPSFMAENTSFATFGEMLRGRGPKGPSVEVWKAGFSSAAWDAYVRATTSFDDWAAMRRAAAANLRRRR